MASQFASAWKAMEPKTGPNEMTTNFHQDHIIEFLHSHPNVIKVAKDQDEIFDRINMTRYHVIYGHNAQATYQLLMMTDSVKDKSEEIKKYHEMALKGRERERKDARLPENSDQQTIPITELINKDTEAKIVDYSSEHFFQKLLESSSAIQERNHGVYVAHGYAYQQHNERDPQRPQYMSPVGRSYPEYDNRSGDFTGYKYEAGYYHGRDGYPRDPHPQLEDRHHSSGTLAKTAKLLGLFG